MPNYNSILKRMPPNAVGRKRIESVESAVGSNFYPTGLTWDASTYKYTLAMNDTDNILSNSQQVFGEQLILSGSSGGGLKLYEGTSNGVHSLTVKAPDEVTADKTLTLPDGPPSVGGYALVSTDLGVMSWAAFSGANTYLTGLAYAPSTQKITATMSDATTIATDSLFDFGNSIKLSGSNTGEVRFHEQAGADYVALRAPTSIASSFYIALPIAAGAAGEVLAVDSSGGQQLEWVSNSSSNYYVTGGAYDAVGDEIDFSGTTGFPAFSVDTSAFTKGVTVAGTTNYMGYFTATNALTGTAGFQYDGTDIDTTDADMTMTSATTLKPELTLTNTNTDATSAYLTFYQNDSVNYGDAGDTLGTIKFDSRGGIGTRRTFAEIYAVSDVIYNTLEQGSIRIRTQKAGTLTDTLVARNGLVGVNTNNPAFGLDVVGTTQLSGNSSIEGTLTTTGVATLGNNSVTNTQAAGNDSTRIATTAYVKAQSYGSMSSWDVRTDTGAGGVASVTDGGVVDFVGNDGITTSNSGLSASWSVDNTVVRTTGVQTIGGAKSFSSLLTASTGLTVAGTTNLGSTTNITGTTSVIESSTPRTQFKVIPTLNASKVQVLDTGMSPSSASHIYYPRIEIKQDGSDGVAGEHAGYPSLYFLKFGPSGAASPAGGDPVGWRIASSGAAGVASAPQTMVWDYSTDQSSYSNKLSLSEAGVLTAATFAGELLGTIDSTTTAATQSAGNSTTKVATTAFVTNAISGGGLGTVTSVAIGGNDGIDVDSGSPITSAGTIQLGLSNIPNASLANSSVSYGGVSLALGASDATPAFNLSDATAYTGDTALVTVGTVTAGTWQGTAIADTYIASESNWNQAYDNYISSVSYSSPTLTLTQRDGGTITTSIAGGAATGTIGGSITDNQIAFGATTANSIEGSANLTYDGTNLTLARTADATSRGISIKDNEGTETIRLATASGDHGLLYLRGGTGGNSIYLDANGSSFLDGGNVGIGTTAPGKKLHVEGAIAVSGAEYAGDSGYGHSIYTYNQSGAQTLRIYSDSRNVSGGKRQFIQASARLDINSSEHLGLGTTSSGEYLHLYSAATANMYIDAGGSFLFRDADDSSALRMQLYSATGKLLLNDSSAATKIQLQPSGDSYITNNLGIGTTTPAYKLDVVGTTQLSGAVTIPSTLTTTGVATLGNNSISNTQSAGNNTTRLATTEFVTTAVAANSGTPGGSDTQIQFNNGGAFGGSANFTWDDTDVFIDTSGGGKLKLGAATEYIQGSGSDMRIHASDNILMDAEDSVLFRTSDFALETDAASEKFRFKMDTGRLGIGTNAPSYPLHVAAPSTGLAALFTNTSSNGEVMRLTTTGDSRTMHFQTDHIYMNGGAFHIGNDNTDMYLRVSGKRLGVGTSNPTSGFLMDVSGSTRQYGSFSLVNGAITSNPGTNHLWASGATLFWGTSQIGTTTPGAGAIEGTATAGEVAYGDGSNSITSTSNFTFADDVGMTIQSSVSDKPVITLKNTNANNSAPLLDFIKDSASPAASDDLAGIRFYGDDAGGAQHNFARIDVESPVVTAGAEVGSIKFRTTDGGTDNTGVMILSGSNVGIGTISPTEKLEIFDGNIDINKTTANDKYGYMFRGRTDTGFWEEDTDLFIGTPNSTYIMIDSNNNNTDEEFSIWTNATTTGSATELFTVRESGKVGIGTGSPSRLLDVNAGSATAFLASGTGGGTYGVARIVDNADSVPLELVGQRGDEEGPALRLKHESASPNGGDYVGTVAFTGYTTTNALGNYAAIRGRAIDVTNGSTDGALLFQNFINNSRTTGMILSGAKLGIGSDNVGGFAPSEYLEVRSSADDDPAIKLYNARSPSASGSLILQHRGSSVKIKSSGSAVAPFIWELQGTEEMRLNDGGLVIGATATANGAPLHVMEDGTNNLVANFMSADGIAEIRIGDNANYTRLLTVGSQYKIMPNDGVELMVLDGSANTVTVAGVLSATAKSFNIPHPLYKDKRLVHGSLEGPEHGLYIRGTIEAFKGCLIELPEYWSAMCEDYTVQLTPHGAYTVYIKEKQKDKVMIECSEENYKFDYYIVGARTDETLEVVQDA